MVCIFTLLVTDDTPLKTNTPTEMHVPVGLTLHGKTKQFANQYLITEFFSFGIPLFPMCSYFVNEENGLKIQIPLSKESLYSFYMGNAMIWAGCILFGCSWMFATFLTEWLSAPYIEFTPFIISILVTGFGSYNCFAGTKSAKEEIRKRTVLQMATGTNALPNWLGKAEATKIFESLKTNYNTDWINLIRNQTYGKSDFYRLFSMISYAAYLDHNDEHIRLMGNMEKVFNKKR